MLQKFFERWQKKTVHNRDFLTLLEEGGVAIRDYYQRYVFQAGSNFDGLATKHHEEKSLHPPAITLEKAALIR